MMYGMIAWSAAGRARGRRRAVSTRAWRADATHRPSSGRLRDSRRWRYRHPVGFAELLAHPDVVEELELRAGSGSSPCTAGSNRARPRSPARRPGARERPATRSCSPTTCTCTCRRSTPIPSEAPRLAGFLDHVDRHLRARLLRPLDDRSRSSSAAATACSHEALAGRLRAALTDYVVIDDLDGDPRRLRGLDPRNPVNRAERGGAARAPAPGARDRSVRARRRGELHRTHTEALVAALADFAGDLA